MKREDGPGALRRDGRFGWIEYSFEGTKDGKFDGFEVREKERAPAGALRLASAARARWRPPCHR